MLSDRWWAGLTFELADLLDPGQGVDLHQRVGHADHVHHVHHTLYTHTDTDRHTLTQIYHIFDFEMR